MLYAIYKIEICIGSVGEIKKIFSFLNNKFNDKLRVISRDVLHEIVDFFSIFQM